MIRGRRGGKIVCPHLLVRAPRKKRRGGDVPRSGNKGRPRVRIVGANLKEGMSPKCCRAPSVFLGLCPVVGRRRVSIKRSTLPMQKRCRAPSAPQRGRGVRKGRGRREYGRRAGRRKGAGVCGASLRSGALSVPRRTAARTRGASGSVRLSAAKRAATASKRPDTAGKRGRDRVPPRARLRFPEAVRPAARRRSRGERK